MILAGILLVVMGLVLVVYHMKSRNAVTISERLARRRSRRPTVLRLVAYLSFFAGLAMQFSVSMTAGILSSILGMILLFVITSLLRTVEDAMLGVYVRLKDLEPPLPIGSSEADRTEREMRILEMTMRTRYNVVGKGMLEHIPAIVRRYPDIRRLIYFVKGFEEAEHRFPELTTAEIVQLTEDSFNDSIEFLGRHG